MNNIVIYSLNFSQTKHSKYLRNLGLISSMYNFKCHFLKNIMFLLTSVYGILVKEVKYKKLLLETTFLLLKS